jgi:hypothetical protein
MLLVASIATVAMAAAPVTNARFVAQDASGVAVSTDTLAPPTNLAASGGTSTNLTWTPTVDAYASGYDVLRSVTSGGPYAVVGTVTPGSAAAGSDTPDAPGAYYYVVRAAFQNWRSDSNEASATIAGAPTGSGFRACAPGASAAGAGGDGDGYETSPASGCADDAVHATDTSTGTAGRSTACTNAANDRHVFRDFSFGLPAMVSAINGIEVRVDLGLNNNGGLSHLCVELSPDGGATWTAAQAVTTTSSSEVTYILGSATDPWGRSWAVGELADAMFRVRLTDATSQPNKDYRLEYLAVQVTYTP